MTEEIKESIEELWILITALDGVERGEEHNAYTIKCIKNVINYITNLQQENEKLKYNARGQVNNYFKDKYADEVLKKADLMKDFELTCYKNYELKQENERLNNKIKEQNLLLIEFQDMEQKVDIYKSRCQKAIEYIKMYKCDYSPYELTDSAIRNVLNILNGSDEK